MPRVAASTTFDGIMVRVRWFSWLIGISLLAACDDAPRMERRDDDCQAELVSLRVEVVTAEGARVRGATVTATNLTSNVSITGVTDESGVTTAINETLAPSPVRVVASAGAKVSSAERVQWTCDSCNCVPEPGTLQLQLNP
ncbi:carboxypeptidase regulatory-like domain-containing protein [Pyxidicoccus fallax]|uniref:Carboxypeptidase regulatory-like domain-containing protein n=1 Tax=Pyxidicoccus fallax TaxID=394095 RepID=A0A848LTF5_9BACT|nr:carboxypeptidase-like regulatory domain-containing protein [Pyxidicoccus fallax]NMO20783.1 carboxypeptidase regulatory-like domain-containing protein [Pyxidicoccus fallax]NPC80613.1 carboxypeptidase regulatory-like domain-containing protein [Pyxidicoccus fallax]